MKTISSRSTFGKLSASQRDSQKYSESIQVDSCIRPTISRKSNLSTVGNTTAVIELLTPFIDLGVDILFHASGGRAPNSKSETVSTYKRVLKHALDSCLVTDSESKKLNNLLNLTAKNPYTSLRLQDSLRAHVLGYISAWRNKAGKSPVAIPMSDLIPSKSEAVLPNDGNASVKSYNSLEESSL